VAITNMDQLINAMVRSPRAYGKDTGTAEAVGISHTPWYQTGIVGAGAAPTGGLNGATFSGPALAGQIAVPSAVAGATSYLARWSALHTGNIGHLWLVDRQWGNVPVVTTTGSQAITSPTWVTRDESGSTNGAGVLLALECSSATGNGAPVTNTTVSYTNSAGTAGRTATLASFPATAVVGTWVPFSLQAGDQGVRSVQSITLGTSYVSGAIHLATFRLIAELEVPSANTGFGKSFTGLNLPAVWDASVLQLVYWPTGTALGSVAGSVAFAQG
jgi:hypothetical protein